MRRLEAASEAEMILAFLRAERASGRQWAEWVSRCFAGRWKLLDHPDLDDQAENDFRRQALSTYRGYGANSWLFAGFPADVHWWRVSLSRADVAGLYHAHSVWDDLTEGTRKVSVAARNVDRITHDADPRVNENIRAVIKADLAGQSFEPIIIASDAPEGRHVLVEGHTRACAYATNFDGPEVQALAGYSPELSAWQFWGF
jgi:hypothetical protein